MKPEQKPFFSQPTRVLAHRGDSANFPENTLPSFESAWKLQVDVIETDLHLTRDGVCVVWHDPTVDRTTDGTGTIRQLSWDYLQSLDAGYRFTPDGGETYPFRGQGIRMVRLTELLRELPEARFNLDLKTDTPELTEEFIRIIRKTKSEDRVLAASFLDKPIRTIRKALPRIPTSLPRREINMSYVLHRLGLLGLKRQFHGETLPLPEYHQGRRILSPQYIRALHRRGLKVFVWTINQEEDMNRLLDWGADGIFTDYPRRLMKVLNQRDSQQISQKGSQQEP